MLYFSNVMNRVSVDPLGGTDALSVIGNAAANTVTVDAQATTAVTIDSLLPLQTPIANVENLAISSLGSKDTITVKTYDSVNAYIFVDGGPPTTNPKKGDSLTVQNMSPKPKIQTQPGGSGAGSIFVSYPQTTHNSTRIDFQSMEKTPVIKQV